MNRIPVPTIVHCLRVSRALQRYLDGEVDASTAHRVAAHLDECRRCGLEAETYRAIKQAVCSGSGVDELALHRLHAFHQSLVSDLGGS